MMINYPNVGDKVVSNQPESLPRVVVVKVDPANDLIEIRTADGACGSHVGLKRFESNYTKADQCQE